MTKPKKRAPLHAYKAMQPGFPYETFAKAVIEGELAAAAGVDATANPHAEGTPEHDGWMVGWEGVERAYVPPESRAPAKRKPQLELF